MHGLSVDQEGNFYIAEVDSGRAQKYRPRPGANPAFLLGKAVTPAERDTVQVEGEVQSTTSSKQFRRSAVCTFHSRALHFSLCTLRLILSPLLYFLFFFSGLSGLIYQVVWVRVFGNVFGNTVYSASVVVAVFMLGLGAGSYIAGRVADRRYAATTTGSLLRAYGYVELTIALMGLGDRADPAAPRPRLGDRVLVSRDAAGWYVLSTASYAARDGDRRRAAGTRSRC